MTLPCADQINASSAPAPPRTVILRVALSTRVALGAGLLRDEPDPDARYFAKDGLVIRAGASFELVVPPEWRGRLTVATGAAHDTVACRGLSVDDQSE